MMIYEVDTHTASYKSHMDYVEAIFVPFLLQELVIWSRIKATIAWCIVANQWRNTAIWPINAQDFHVGKLFSHFYTPDTYGYSICSISEIMPYQDPVPQPGNVKYKLQMRLRHIFELPTYI
jgi:hypothetical protein